MHVCRMKSWMESNNEAPPRKVRSPHTSPCTLRPLTQPRIIIIMFSETVFSVALN